VTPDGQAQVELPAVEKMVVVAHAALPLKITASIITILRHLNNAGIMEMELPSLAGLGETSGKNPCKRQTSANLERSPVNSGRQPRQAMMAGKNLVMVRNGMCLGFLMVFNF
jgi:hypothetical protein